MLKPGDVVDRYQIVAEIGRGGMAVVYRVRHTALQTDLALKLLLSRHPTLRARAMQEGRVQARLQHPNVLPVTDVVDVEGSPGLVMPLVEGPDLDVWLHGHTLDLAGALALFRGVAAGVAAAHAQGVVHRDLKPANILVVERDGAPVPVVMDFGIAKVLGDLGGETPLTRSGVGLGTPAYMAPEQLRDARHVDRRADIWSLGCLLYRLVAGREAFSGPTVVAIAHAAGAEQYTPVAELRPDLPAAVGAAISGALRADPSQRFGSVAELLATLDGRAALPPRTSTDTFLPSSLDEDAPGPAEGASAGRRSRPLLLPVIALVSATLVATGLWLLPRPSPAPPPAAEPAPAEPPDAAADPTPSAAPDAPQPDPAPAATARTAQATAPARADRATVRLQGDAGAVSLVDDAGARHPLRDGATLAPGAYQIRATFENLGEVAAGEVRLRAGQSITLSCSATFAMCEAQ